MKTVHKRSEVEKAIEKGTPVAFSTSVQVTVTVRQVEDATQATLVLRVGDAYIGEIQADYTSVDAIMEAFQLDDEAEIWEILSKRKAPA